MVPEGDKKKEKGEKRGFLEKERKE